MNTTPETWPLVIDAATGDTQYVGPLFPAMRLAEIDNGPTDVSVRRGNWWVGNDHCWGSGSSFNEAMRFYLGATFGPTDDEYDAAHLIKALLLHVEEQEVSTQHYEFTVGEVDDVEVSEQSDTEPLAHTNPADTLWGVITGATGTTPLSTLLAEGKDVRMDETVSRNRSFDTENPWSLDDCAFYGLPHTFDCWGRVGFVVDDDADWNGVLCEGHYNNKKAGA